MTIFGAACFLALLNIYSQYRKYGEVSFLNIINAVGLGIVFILAIPVLNMVFAKMQTRKFILSADGIDTSIGSQQGRVPWKAVESIKTVGELIIITRTNANIFTIPKRAFGDDAQRERFIQLANEFRSTRTSA